MACMRWQRNNLDVVAEGMRRRRWQQKGLPMPSKPMTRAQAGKLGGKKGSAARIAALGPERVKAIAEKARRVRWERYYAAKAQRETTAA